MKKSLIFSIIFAIISFASIVNVSATNISSHSIDVTVGEVDEISVDDEKQDIHSPDTGLFELGTDSIVIATTATISTIIILACIFGYIYRKRAK